MVQMCSRQEGKHARSSLRSNCSEVPGSGRCAVVLKDGERNLPARACASHESENAVVGMPLTRESMRHGVSWELSIRFCCYGHAQFFKQHLFWFVLSSLRRQHCSLHWPVLRQCSAAVLARQGASGSMSEVSLGGVLS